MPNWFVVVMGLGTVFVVLILIIGLCWILSLVCRERKQERAEVEPATSSPAPTVNRGELAAVVAAAISEYTGTDASALRILSIKKI